MKWEDITINFDKLDLEKLYADWQWLFSGKFRPVMMSTFADLFFEKEDGRIYFLDTIEGTIEVIANNFEEFKKYINNPENIEAKLLSNTIFELLKGNRTLKENECYSFKILPILGGKIEADNITILSLRVGLSINGQIHKQVKEMRPDTK